MTDPNGPGGRRREPCERCGASRDCETPAEDLWATIDGENTRVCPDCLQWANDRDLLGGNAPDFDLPEDHPLRERFAEIDEQLEQRDQRAQPVGAIRWR